MNKICPILNINRTDKTESCKKEGCQLWDEINMDCGLVVSEQAKDASLAINLNKMQFEREQNANSRK